jgi:hypothetical protein
VEAYGSTSDGEVVVAACRCCIGYVPNSLLAERRPGSAPSPQRPPHGKSFWSSGEFPPALEIGRDKVVKSNHSCVLR